jgi:hypothetical protein
VLCHAVPAAVAVKGVVVPCGSAVCLLLLQCRTVKGGGCAWGSAVCLLLLLGFCSVPAAAAAAIKNSEGGAPCGIAVCLLLDKSECSDMHSDHGISREAFGKQMLCLDFLVHLPWQSTCLNPDQGPFCVIIVSGGGMLTLRSGDKNSTPFAPSCCSTTSAVPVSAFDPCTHLPWMMVLKGQLEVYVYRVGAMRCLGTTTRRGCAGTCAQLL